MLIISQKKEYLSFFGLFLMLLILAASLPGKILAGFCYTDAASSNCNADFDCSNNLNSVEGNNPAFCNTVAPGSCFEVITVGPATYHTICFARLNQPTPTPAPCGSLNYICCSPPTLCEGGLTPQSTGIGDCFCVNPTTPIPTRLPIPTAPPVFNTRAPTSVPAQNSADMFCVGYGADSPNPKINTALGCLPVRIKDFVTEILKYLFGIAGGISFLLMVYGFIQMTTSSGDPKAVQGARETVSSAVTGLLVSIFALFLLRLIVVDILKIPGIN